MARLKHKGVTLSGTLRKDGVAFYTRGGKVIMRSAKSEQPLRRTRGQFVARQRLAHNNTLWKRLRDAAEPMFAGSVTAYARFRTLMSKLPVVFLTKKEHENMASLLLEGMPVSDGLLQDLDYRLGEVEGEPALLTSVRMKGPLPEGAEGSVVLHHRCTAGAIIELAAVAFFFDSRWKSRYCISVSACRAFVLVNSKRYHPSSSSSVSGRISTCWRPVLVISSFWSEIILFLAG